MWAVVVDVEINDVAAAVQGLTDQVVPMVRETAGFVSAYWIRLDDHRGTSFVVYETESQARTGAPPEGASSEGVTMTSVKIGEVLAHA
jgi:hypothetical protein